MKRFRDSYHKISEEINEFKIKRMLRKMCDSEVLTKEGERKFTKYFIKQTDRENT